MYHCSPLWSSLQIPQYALIGAGEICTVVGMIELLYREIPPSVSDLTLTSCPDNQLYACIYLSEPVRCFPFMKHSRL